MDLLERIIAVDWSGDKGPGQRRKIWAGIWTRTPRGRVGSSDTGRGTLRLEAGRTRDELTEHLLALGDETPGMVTGIDCCFSYPAWFLAEHGCSTVFELWEHVASGQGERWLGTTCPPAERDPRFWGKPHRRPEVFSGANLHRMMRRTDMENKIEQALAGGDPERAAKMKGIQPKSPFQIGGSGSVGTGSLRAMRHLLTLHRAGWRIWPFDSAVLGGPAPTPLLTEMYTRLLTGPVKKANPLARRAYLLRRRTDPLYSALPRAVLASAYGSEDAFDALVCCLEMVRHQREFRSLQATADPTLALEGETWRPGVR